MRSGTDQAILNQLYCLDNQLMCLSHEINLVIEAMTVERNRALAIGILLPMKDRLDLATQLWSVINAIHLMPSTGEKGGA